MPREYGTFPGGTVSAGTRGQQTMLETGSRMAHPSGHTAETGASNQVGHHEQEAGSGASPVSLEAPAAEPRGVMMPDLPWPWRAFFDPATDKCYYHNHQTDITAWDRPFPVPSPPPPPAPAVASSRQDGSGPPPLTARPAYASSQAPNPQSVPMSNLLPSSGGQGAMMRSEGMEQEGAHPAGDVDSQRTRSSGHSTISTVPSSGAVTVAENEGPRLPLSEPQRGGGHVTFAPAGQSMGRPTETGAGAHFSATEARQQQGWNPPRCRGGDAGMNTGWSSTVPTNAPEQMQPPPARRQPSDQGLRGPSMVRPEGSLQMNAGMEADVEAVAEPRRPPGWRAPPSTPVGMGTEAPGSWGGTQGQPLGSPVGQAGRLQGRVGSAEPPPSCRTHTSMAAVRRYGRVG